MRWPVRVGVVLGILLLGAMPAAAASDGESTVIEDVSTVVAVVVPSTTPDFPVSSLMRANCEIVVRTVAADGSAEELMSCQLSAEPVMVPEFQGTPPTTTVGYGGGECIWQSDYWATTDESTVFASEFEVVVTPSGRVYSWSAYPAEPLDCPEAEPSPTGSPAATSMSEDVATPIDEESPAVDEEAAPVGSPEVA